MSSHAKAGKLPGMHIAHPAQPLPRLRPRQYALAIFRIARLAFHLLKGLWLTRSQFAQRPQAERNELLQGWSRHLLNILDIRVRERGLHDNAELHTAGRLIVANHISWLDIFVINSSSPCRFVAKSEIRHWPLIGKLVTFAGTLYIERGSRRATSHAKKEIDGHLKAGDCVAFFPEGTTTDGSTLKPFRGGLIQSALDHGIIIQPVLLQYRSKNGQRSMAAAYIDEVSLLSCIWQLACEPYTVAELDYLSPRCGLPESRKEITRLIEQEMRHSMQHPDSAL
ncbi:lysophospholipid acyltransferase family protein [Chitinilyticum aquatile]|uniref:lysophospholipid acyltransferase family protein n=1 Tax=Chitinilyticum aquatile TaxID=362520 RepID=UPI0009D752DF|nr:lysophospholipid acyltransferase family protein [Chitinilyticum aquatile]